MILEQYNQRTQEASYLASDFRASLLSQPRAPVRSTTSAPPTGSVHRYTPSFIQECFELSFGLFQLQLLILSTEFPAYLPAREISSPSWDQHSIAGGLDCTDQVNQGKLVSQKYQNYQ